MADMKAINELYAKRATIMNRIREMNKDGAVAAENQDAFDQAHKDFMNLTAQIETEERFAIESATTDDAKGQVPKDEKKTAFLNYLRTGVIPKDSVSEATASMGYAVPETTRASVIKKMFDYGQLLGSYETINTTGTENLPVEGTTPTLYWVEEGGAFTDSSPTLDRVQLGAFKGGIMIKVSEELLQDSAFDIESYINDAAARALAIGIEEATVANAAAGKPTGFLGTAEAALTTSVSSSFSYDDIIDLYTNVKDAYARNGSFVMSRTALGIVMKMKDTSGRYIFQPATTAGQPDMILAHSIKTTTGMPTLATGAAAMAFGDLRYYKLGLRGGMYMQRLNERYADNGLVGFRVYQRVDGKLSLSEAVKKAVCK